MKHPARSSCRTPRRAPALVAIAIVSALGSACGGEEDRPPDPEPAPAVPVAADGASEPAGADAGPQGGTTAGAIVEDDWGEDEDAATGGETTGDEATGGDAPPPAAVRHPGPCTVSWSGAARLRFSWDDDGGSSVRIDGDRDGKSDVCAKLAAKDGRTEKVRVDDGCDKSFEAEIVPTYEADSNLATATYTETKDGKASTREITLVALPSFVGVAPGYPLWAAKDDVKLKTKKGLVTSATVKAPTEGPPVEVKLTYDQDGRISRVKEDFEIDGSVDRQFDYKYDDAGNVTRVTLKMRPEDGEGKKLKTQSTASLRYTCWADKEPAPPPAPPG